MVDLAKLSDPFPPEKIEWRVGPTTRDKSKGMALAYIDARDVMDRLDEVCGAENWQRRYSHADGKTICEIGILCGDHWVWKADGAGDTDIDAEKGAISTAFKRSAVNWGIGRYLYDMDSPWVAIEQRGNSYVIADSELSRLRGGKPKPPAQNGSAPTNGERSSAARTSGSKPEDAGSSPAGPAKDKTPLWERESFEVPFLGDWQRWDGLMYEAIKKAPTLEKLTKLQADNAETIDRYSVQNSNAQANLNQAFVRRMGDLSQGEVVNG
jgi:hypothetical protein